VTVEMLTVVTSGFRSNVAGSLTLGLNATESLILGLKESPIARDALHMYVVFQKPSTV